MRETRMCVRIDVTLSREAILTAIRNRTASGKPVTLDAIADEVGCHRITVWRAIQDLRHTGRIEMTQRGYRFVPTQYEITDADR
jgi:biotin operon repressor